MAVVLNTDPANDPTGHADPASDPAGPAAPGASAADWAAQAQRLLGAFEAAAADPDGFTDHSAECRYCPLCQGMAVLRRTGPDVLDRVAELAAGLAATLRATQPPVPPGPSEPPPQERVADGSGAAAPSFVRIDITD